MRWNETESLIYGHLKLQLFPAGILAKAIVTIHSETLYRLDISTFYFTSHCCSDFRPLEIHINLGLPLSSATFTVNSHADKHFYQYIYLFQIFQILYSMKSVFLFKCTLRFLARFLIFKFDLNVKRCSCIW